MRLSQSSGRSGKGDWTLVCGSGFEEADLDDLPGDILAVGPCACDEVGDALRKRYPDRRIYQVEEHNDLMTSTRYQARLMGVTPVMMVPLNPLVSALTLTGSTARRKGRTRTWAPSKNRRSTVRASIPVRSAPRVGQ